MTIPARLESCTDAWPLRLGSPSAGLPPKTTTDRASKTRVQFSTAELAFRTFAAFRAHPHINNVLTHISRANWIEVEKSLNRILDLSTTTDGLSPLEENIIELMVSERGITGKILKP